MVPVAGDSSLGCDLLRRLIHSIHEGPAGRAALGAIALVGALAVVEPQVAIQVLLQLVERLGERLAEGRVEELFFPMPVTARGTLGSLKSSAIRPRQPEVPK